MMLNIERSFTNFLYFKMTDFWSKAVQKKKKKKLTNGLLSAISQETNESLTIHDKTNPEPLTGTLPAISNTATPPLLKRKLSKKSRHQTRH